MKKTLAFAALVVVGALAAINYNQEQSIESVDQIVNDPKTVTFFDMFSADYFCQSLNGTEVIAVTPEGEELFTVTCSADHEDVSHIVRQVPLRKIWTEEVEPMLNMLPLTQPIPNQPKAPEWSL